MTPQERQMLDELFDRLASLENSPRDPDAVAAINEGLERAPNALYPLVQTALVQDEALKRADARIRELESQLELDPGDGRAPQGGFLDSMRGALFGQREQHGSVPTVRPGAAPGASPWGNTSVPPRDYPAAAAPPPEPSGGSFLGTAAASAAGVVGGALLMNSMRGLFGGSHAAPGVLSPGGSTTGAPWGPGASNSNLARDAGLGDISRGGRTAAHDDPESSQRTSLTDMAQNDADDDDDADSDDDFDDGDDTDNA